MTLVGDDHTIPKIAFGSRTGAYRGAGPGKQADLLRGDMNRVHRGEVRPQQAFPAQQRHRSQPIFA